MIVMQIGGRAECVCGSRGFDVQITAVLPDRIDYAMTCHECGSALLYREPEARADVLSAGVWSDD